MLRDYMGALEAERRVERDHWLVHAFTWTRNLRMALDEDAPFIAGRKGAGKSAVAQRIGHLERPGNGVRYYDANFYIVDEEVDKIELIEDEAAGKILDELLNEYDADRLYLCILFNEVKVSREIVKAKLDKDIPFEEWPPKPEPEEDEEEEKPADPE